MASKQQIRNGIVLERLIALSDGNAHTAEAIAHALDGMIDDLIEDDDISHDKDPRGDNGDEIASVWSVEGVDW